MEKIIKTLLKILIMVLILLSLCGCWNRRELNTLGIVLGVGIDSADKPGEIEMTAQMVKSSEIKTQSGKSEPVNKAFINVSETGTDPFDIFRDLTHRVNRKLYTAHNQVIIFSKELAEKGIYESLDLFLRDHETRMTVKVLVAKDRAADIFEADPEFGKIPAAEVAQLLDAQKANSETAQLNVMEFMTCLASKTCCAVAPIIEVKNEDGKKLLNIYGGAVFKNDKVVGELNKKETRGYLWIKNKVSSGVIKVQLKGENMELEIVHASSEVKPVINEDGSVLFKIKIKQTGTLDSKAGYEYLEESDIKLMEKAEEQKIIQEVESAINKALELDTDIFGFGEKINEYKHKEWKKLENNWDKQFKNLKIQIDVSVKITGDGRISGIKKPEKE